MRDFRTQQNHNSVSRHCKIDGPSRASLYVLTLASVCIGLVMNFTESQVIRKSHAETPEAEKSFYLKSLKKCSGAEVNYYSLPSEYSKAMSVEVYEAHGLSVVCLEQNFRLDASEVWNFGSRNKNVSPIDHLIYWKTVVPSPFNVTCAEKCSPSPEIILEPGDQKGHVFYIRGENDWGIEAQFVRSDTIHLMNSMASHVRNYLYDTERKTISWLPDGKLTFKEDHILVEGQKSYFDGNGPYWFDSKIDYDGNILQLIQSQKRHDNCLKKEKFAGRSKEFYSAFDRQGLREFCVQW